MKRDELRWNGWGLEDQVHVLNDEQKAWIADLLQMAMPLPATPAPSAEAMEIPEPRLGKPALAELAEIVGDGSVTDALRERLRHARGQSYHDLLHYRSGKLLHAPDAVVYPSETEQVLALLRWADVNDVALIPYGGGSSVVGGVTARSTPGQSAVVTLDTTDMNRVLEVLPTDSTATAQAGIYGPALEEALGEDGFTLGHFPQSFQFSTLGGWIAARGAGQQSNRYGKAEDWFVSARVATPTGLWSTESLSATASGPHLGGLVAGSEGTLGIITDATVRLSPAPARRHYGAFLFRDFASGLDAARALTQSHLPLAMIRLSDADETRFQGEFSRLGNKPSLAERLVQRYIRWRGLGDDPCLMLVGAEGEIREVERTYRQVRWYASRHGGFNLGERPGKRWFATRFDAPFLRDPLLDHGIGVDTLETATSWSNLARLHGTVRNALRTAIGNRGVILAHLSHSYDDGASLYFTIVFPRDLLDPIAQWRLIKEAASEAIVRNGGTISHHHGVGEDHLPWMAWDKGPVALSALRALKTTLDPRSVLNPGKLMPQTGDDE